MASTIKKNIFFYFAIFSFLVLWKLLSVLMGSEVILPSPETSLSFFITLFGSSDFYRHALTTVSRVLAAFFLASSLGIATGILCGIFPLFRRFFQPYLIVIRSTPVMSVILVALVWFHTGFVPVFVAFLTAYPIVVETMQNGFKSVDPKLLEMADLYKVQKKRVLMKIYLPALLPFLKGALKSAQGYVWKVVVAAEILSQPKTGLGSEMYTARLYLETVEVFALTAVIILLSAIMDISIDIFLTSKEDRV